MDPQIVPFLTTLSILWFLVYWILGGVFFAIVTVIRLGRIRKVRFSCLFSILSLFLGVSAAYLGMRHSQTAVNACLAEASNKAEVVAAMFGCGMVLANGCGARALVLLGQGNLRSFVVLICLGVTAYMTLTGLIAPVRAVLLAPTAISISGGTFASQTARLIVGGVFAAGLVLFAASSSSLRKSGKDLLGGTIVGALVVAGWIATGWLANDEFDPVPPASLSFVAPIGETIQFAMIATGVRPGFGVAVVAGVLLGSLVSACGNGQFHLEGFKAPRDMLRYMLGGTLMGVGGALAMGCSIGQGLTGLSTLAYSSMLSAAGILAGAWLALRGPLPRCAHALRKQTGGSC